MKMPVRVICRPMTALGVGLGGIAPIESANGEAAAAALAELAGAPAKGGIVLIEAALYEALPTAVLRRIRKEGAPILQPFPGPAPLPPGAVPEQDLLDLLRRAVGYRMRLR